MSILLLLLCLWWEAGAILPPEKPKLVSVCALKRHNDPNRRDPTELGPPSSFPSQWGLFILPHLMGPPQRSPARGKIQSKSCAPALPSGTEVTAPHSAVERWERKRFSSFMLHQPNQTKPAPLAGTENPVLAAGTAQPSDGQVPTLASTALCRGSVTPKHHPSALLCQATATTALHSPATTGAGEHTDTNAQFLTLPFPALFPPYSQGGILRDDPQGLQG